YGGNRNKVPNLTGSIQQFRQTICEAKMRAQHQGESVIEGLDVYDLTTDFPSKLKLRIYKPLSPEANGAVMIYFHGGGWAMGDLEGEDSTCRTLCVQIGLNIVSVDYRLAPENPHPAAIQDSITALRWVYHTCLCRKGLGIANSTSVDRSSKTVLPMALTRVRFTLAGPVLGQTWYDIPMLSGTRTVLCLSEPHYQRMGLKSMDQFADTPILNQPLMKQFLEWYQPYDQTDPTVSPLLFRRLDASPPCFIMICGRDPLRDEALAYADKLEEKGYMRVAVYSGMPHAFWILPELTTTKTATQDLIDGVRWLMGSANWK
ncbi:hypothetical protein M747DRAFT_240581, partial [Aspergillus niger ATCC 13496]